MSGLTREIFLDGLETGEKRGMIELLVEQYNNNMVTKEYAAKKLNITEEEFLELTR